MVNYHRFLAMALVKVVYISENHQKEEVFKNLYKLKLATYDTKNIQEAQSKEGIKCQEFFNLI